ncbi:Uncharacterised protein [uncultured archaeon]|nr:Uncharacterised protein [uncultured archaeon]
MILPAKHIKFSESFIGFGAILLELLKDKKNVDELWAEFEVLRNSKRYPSYQSYDNFILCINLLYCLKSIDIDESGRLYKCS